MRTRMKRVSAIGTAIGLVLLASAVTPAAAAPQPTAFTASSCSSFKGATTTGLKASFSGVLLRGGDTITTSVSPSSAGTGIGLSATTGLNFLFGAGSMTGYTFAVPADGYYNLTWSVKNATATSYTWSFSATCSSTSVAPSPSPSPTTTTKPVKGNGKGRG